MDTEAACINNDPLIRSSIANMVAIPRNTCIIQPMNKILYSKAHRLANGKLVIPFSCPEVAGYSLHEPGYNRTQEDQAMAEAMARRIRLALFSRGLVLEGINWFSMCLTVTENT